MKNSLQQDLRRVVETFQLPGMAVVLLQQNEVIFNQGFGYANVEEQQPFTDETVGLIASVTKSFTAGLTGCLVDRGIVEWTRPVREYIPTFKMMDDFATRELTLEDMLCHRTGLPYHENLLAHGVDRELTESGRAFRAELLRRLAHFDPCSSFRSHFQYQDIVYSCAGAVLEHVANEDYETLVTKYLLQPLDMNMSTFVRAKARASNRLAQPYALVDGDLMPIAHCDTRYIAPSAGLYSTAKDMAKWLSLHLSRGNFGGQQVISEKSMEWMHSPHMVESPTSGLNAGPTTYGQGWRQNTLHGQPMISHGGSFNGYRTFVGFLPEQDAGVIVFTNLNLTEGSSAAGMIALDHLLGIDGVDERIDFFQQRNQFFRDRDSEQLLAFERGRNLQNPPSHNLAQYQGHYMHPGYGEFTVTLKEDTLYQTYDGRTFPLAPYNGETFSGHFQSTENHLLNMTFAFESVTSPHNSSRRDIIALRVPLIPEIPTPQFVKEP